MSNYPVRTRRNCSIKSALKSSAQPQADLNSPIWVVGRIIGILDDGFVLQDESGRMEIINYRLKIINYGVGDVVEVRIENYQLKIINGVAEVTNSRGEIVDKSENLYKSLLKSAGGASLAEFFVAEDLKVLAPCQAEFFIPLAAGEAPNYKRAIIDTSLMERLKQRQKITKALRDFFWDRGFLEVETPIVVKLPGMEPYLDVFKTQFVSLPYEGRPARKEEMFLITSPEYAMKKLLVSGYEKIFQLTKSFRNKEDESNLHNPEFTILEWYRAYASYEEIMTDTEDLMEYLAKFIHGKSILEYQGHKVDVSKPWIRITVEEAFQQYAGVARENFENPDRLREIAKAKGYSLKNDAPYEDAFFSIFINEIEPKLGFDKPAILYKYPAQMAALSKKCEDNPKYSERFEVYVAGMELCNAFTELNDPTEQRERLEQERKERQKLQKDDYPVDQSFIGALEFGLPPSGGIALGVDRLVMLLTDTPDIRDILFFPHRDL